MSGRGICRAQGIEDVTAKVNAAAKPGMSAADAGKAQLEEMSTLEKDCSGNGFRCDVVTLYSGALYHLYKYKRYDDIRLVMAPEFTIAFFGGDPDNFEYPRYDLDISFFRAYENDKPAKTENYLKWSKTGIKDGDLVFVSGHPGRTGRLLTMDQLAFLRDVQYPWQLKTLNARIEMLQKFSAASEEKAREAQSDVFGLQNSCKAINGYQDGLLDKQLMAKKAADEKALREFVSADAKLKTGVWRSVGGNRQGRCRAEGDVPAVHLCGQPGGLPRELGGLCTDDRACDDGKGEAQQSAHSRLPGLGIADGGTTTVLDCSGLQRPRTASASAEPEGNAAGTGRQTTKRVVMALAGKSPEERAKELIDGTELQDVAVRKKLVRGW